MDFYDLDETAQQYLASQANNCTEIDEFLELASEAGIDTVNGESVVDLAASMAEEDEPGDWDLNGCDKGSYNEKYEEDHKKEVIEKWTKEKDYCFDDGTELTWNDEIYDYGTYECITKYCPTCYKFYTKYLYWRDESSKLTV